MFMDLSKFRRVNEIFDFTFEIRAHRAFRNLLDINVECLNIRNQIHCALQEMVIHCKYDIDYNIFMILYVNFRAIKI